MKRSEQWTQVLDLEVQRWSAMRYEELLSALQEMHTYQIERTSTKYQVEVEILERTDQYLHVMVAVDDGKKDSGLADDVQARTVAAQRCRFSWTTIAETRRHSLKGGPYA